MKTRILTALVAATFWIGFFSLPIGCSTPPTERVAQVRTLKAIGETVATTMETAAKLRVDNRITDEQWKRIADIYDNRYLPAYRLAVSAVSANLSSVASPDLAAIATELLNAIAAYQK